MQKYRVYKEHNQKKTVNLIYFNSIAAAAADNYSNIVDDDNGYGSSKDEVDGIVCSLNLN